MKTLLLAVTLLLATTAQAELNTSLLNYAKGGIKNTSTAQQATDVSANGTGEFSFAMSFSGSGISAMKNSTKLDGQQSTSVRDKADYSVASTIEK